MLPSALKPRRRVPAIGLHLDLAVMGLEFHRTLRRGAEQGEVPIVHIEHVGAGVGLLQLTVGQQRLRAGQGEAAGGDDLEDVALADIPLQTLYIGTEGLVIPVGGDQTVQRQGGG